MAQERIYGAGESIGPFQVVRLLGTGATGIVYEARPDPIQRADLVAMGMTPVALKVARLDASAREPEERRQMVERLYREYQTLLGLMNPGYPNLPEVYEVGWHEQVPFLAMEYVSGLSLEDVLDQQPAMEPMLEVLLELCAAVAILHDRGIVHRDINPGNVLLCIRGPVLIDFGHCQPPLGHRLTGEGELIGTTLYASPQAEAAALEPTPGRPYLATPADDVWALGVIAYEVLTGDVPWRTPPQRRESLLREMLEGPPRHPSDVNPEVPRVLGDAVLKLLQPEPYLRPPHARAALELLKPAVRAAVVTGRVPRRPWPRVPPTSGDSELASRPVAEPGTAAAEHSLREYGWKGLAIAAAMVVAFGGMALAARWGVEAVWRSLGRPTWTAATPDGAKVGPGLPKVASAPGPQPGQMRAPCAKQYVEEDGGCWKELSVPNGTPCPTESPYVRESKGKDGGVRCLIAVMRSPSTIEEPEKGGR